LHGAAALAFAILYQLRQVGQFHEGWRNYFVPLIFRKAQVERYATLPTFSFVDEPAPSVWSRVAASIGLMLLPAVVLLSLGLKRLQHFPVV
jgi:ABC-type glycerol-3-phosphate transport system permease component